jgi:hypothetical protein
MTTKWKLDDVDYLENFNEDKNFFDANKDKIKMFVKETFDNSNRALMKSEQSSEYNYYLHQQIYLLKIIIFFLILCLLFILFERYCNNDK